MGTIVQAVSRKQRFNRGRFLRLWFDHLGIHSKRFDVPQHPHLTVPQRIGTRSARTAKSDDAAGVGHEPGLIAKLAFNDNIPALHCRTAARPAISSDMDGPSQHGGADRHARISIDRDVTGCHSLASTPARIALNLDSRAVIQSGAVITHAALKANLGTGRQSDAEVMPGKGILYSHRVTISEGGLNLLVDGTDRPVADSDRHITRAAAVWGPTAQVWVSEGPS